MQLQKAVGLFIGQAVYFSFFFMLRYFFNDTAVEKITVVS